MNIQILDMAGATIEHSTVIVNFVAAIRKQLKNSTCFVYSDNVQYKWKLESGEDKTVIPDASINCQTKSKKGNSFVSVPRFVMEVVSPSTEKYDREGKMELDWRKKQVEIYTLDYDEQKEPKYYLFKIITEQNKEELQIVHFPTVKITFDELFDFE